MASNCSAIRLNSNSLKVHLFFNIGRRKLIIRFVKNNRAIKDYVAKVLDSSPFPCWLQCFPSFYLCLSVLVKIFHSAKFFQQFLSSYFAYARQSRILSAASPIIPRSQLLALVFRFQILKPQEYPNLNPITHTSGFIHEYFRIPIEQNLYLGSPNLVVLLFGLFCNSSLNHRLHNLHFYDRNVHGF
jgi:hypothetical protein